MTGTYHVKNWDTTYENSRSRSVTALSWVPVPNSHDGEGYSLVMAHKDSAKIFSAWILILQVASKCGVRGVLARENGKPHTAESLAIKTRGNVEWFRIAMQYLASDEIGWLEIEPNSGECQQGDIQVSGNYQSSAEERKKEQNGKKELLDAFFADIKREYPPRDGALCWPQAKTKIESIPIKERELCLSGVIAYRKHLEHKGKLGTAFVKQATTFFNQESWREDWSINVPAVKKELYHD